MKHSILFLLCVLPVAESWAQGETEVQFQNAVPQLDVQEEAQAMTYDATEALPPVGSVAVDEPVMLTIDAPMLWSSPYGGGTWDLHSGFNASVEAGVMCGFGKNNPFRGAAFFTSIDGLYAFPVNDRLTLAAGLGYTRYTGWGQSQSALDIFGLANYRFNERLDATLFMSHSFGPLGGNYRSGMHSPYIPGISNACTVVGGELGIKVNESVRFGVGLSVVREEGPQHPLH